MLDLVQAGGWVMVPILLCSILALAIILERSWALRQGQVMPDGLLAQVRAWLQQDALDGGRLDALRNSSQLGRVLAAGLSLHRQTLEERKTAIEDAGRRGAVELERFLAALGTIAMISPLLGLLGTVWGLIVVFDQIMTTGLGQPSDLAGGIAQALITTAAGLAVAIPAVIFHRFFQRKVSVLVSQMESVAHQLMDVLQQREQGTS
ncbi:MAG: MotA/TolQ/ExbB proton channel family protein [Gammaproteobacteria bacterium]|nr:MotA/TolQ/ExbB proton channel family protein [Gammaproteobacteria bacterium]